MFKRVKKSLFLKQFLIYMTVLLLSFVCLGLVLTNAFKLYFMNQRERQLIQQAERISEQYAISLYTGIIDRVKINRELMILEDNLGASAMLVARNGRVLFVSGGIDADWIGAYVDEASLKKAINGETVVTESISGKTSDYALTVVYPLEADGMVFAALIMNVLLPDVKEQLQNVYLAIFAALAFCGVSSFAALYFSVKRITKPLIEINDAAKVIAGGDFHKKSPLRLRTRWDSLPRASTIWLKALTGLNKASVNL